LHFEFEKIILIGAQFGATSTLEKRIEKHADLEAFLNSFEPLHWNYSTVLIKGSRASQLERLIPFFKSL